MFRYCSVQVELKDELLTSSVGITIFAQSPTVTPTFSPSEQPTPLQYCPDTYDPLFTGYVAGDRIEAENGIYECLTEPYEKYCSIVAFDSSLLEEDENAKDLWSNCWQFVANCYR